MKKTKTAIPSSVHRCMGRDGVIREENSGQDRLLERLYTSFYGRILLKVLTQPGLSRAAGIFLDRKASCFLIRPFIEKNQMDMRPYVKRPYRSFNDFFTREILPTERMIDCDPSHLVSPSDGKLSVYSLDETAEFTIKGSVYTLERILKNPALAKRYEGGYACVFRLCVDDYHRYSYPADGEKSENIRIPGILHTVNPVAVESVPVYHENTREYCLIRTENFGTLLQMEVGAMMVGRIKNYHGPKQVKKGSEKGRFEFGGSTILLLVQKDRVDFREEFLKHTEQGIETQVEMGEWIGTAVCGTGYSGEG